MSVVLDLPREIARRDTDGPRDGLVVAVDAGGTKTFALSLDLATGATSTGHAGPANPDAVGMEATVSAIAEAVREAGDERADVRGVVVAGAGTDAVTIAAAVGVALPGTLFVNDVVAAWATVASGAPAIAVISGTGSNSLGVDERHRARRAGGWGHVFGDEGSGHWLGRELVSAAIRAFDGREPATAMGELLCREVGAADVGAAVIELYAQQVGKTEVAALAPLVGEAAAAGDAVAAALLERAGALLAAHVLAIADALELGTDATLPIGLTGSTWKAGEGLTARFAADVAARLPAAPVTRIETPPAVGALALALHAVGRSDATRDLLPQAARALEDEDY